MRADIFHDDNLLIFMIEETTVNCGQQTGRWIIVYKRESDHSDSCENCKISSVAGRRTLHILRIKKHNSKENRFFRRPKILRIQGKNEYIEEKLWIWIDKRTSRVADAEKSCDVFIMIFNEKPFIGGDIFV